MIAEFHLDNEPIKVDLSHGIDLSDPFTDQGNGPLAWEVDHPRYTPVRDAPFVGSVREGGPVNFLDLLLNPHGNGTHTECLGHITETLYSIDRRMSIPFHRALLITVAPETLDKDEHPREKGDAIIPRAAIENGLKVEKGEEATALIVRTHPYPGGRPRVYSGTNPPYFHPEAMELLREKGILHLLTDLPSVDKERDGGVLPAHHAFWNVPGSPDMSRTITELIQVPDGTEDGTYLLELQVAPIENDAAPSRPLIYPSLG